MALPAAPTALVATPATTSISIAFSQVAATPAISNYEVSLDGGNFVALDPVDAASPVVITGLTNGKNYAVKLRAVNADGVSPGSAVLNTGTVNIVADDPNGVDNPSPFANQGMSVHNKDYNDPDD